MSKFTETLGPHAKPLMPYLEPLFMKKTLPDLKDLTPKVDTDEYHFNEYFVNLCKHHNSDKNILYNVSFVFLIVIFLLHKFVISIFMC